MWGGVGRYEETRAGMGRCGEVAHLLSHLRRALVTDGS